MPLGGFKVDLYQAILNIKTSIENDVKKLEELLNIDEKANEEIKEILNSIKEANKKL